MKQPLASVLIPTYNARQYLPRLLDSLATQSVTNFEAIFVDDLSTDGSVEVLEEAAANDNRIRVYPNAENLGPSAALNRAATLAKSDTLVRLDADDFMTDDRLKKQLAFLEQNPDVDLLASNFSEVDPLGRPGGHSRSPVQEGDALRAMFLFRNPMGHSTVAYRRSAFERVGGYDEGLRASLDYDLLARLSHRGKAYILPERLVFYRTHGENITSTQGDRQLTNALVVQRDLLTSYGFSFSEDQLETHYRTWLYRNHPDKTMNVAALLETRSWLREMDRQNQAKKIFDEAAFHYCLAYVHDGLYRRKNSSITLSDHLRSITTDFGSWRARHAVTQLVHSLKNGF